MNLGLQILNIILSPLVAYLMGIIYYGLYRNIVARAHRRWGPRILQNVIDNIKLFSKREAVSHGLMFHMGPLIMTAGSITTILFIPFFNNSEWLSGMSEYGNLILITYLMVIGPLGNALAVGVSGVPFGVMGVTRGLTRLIALETPFYVSIGMLMAKFNTVSLIEIMDIQAVQGWNIFTNPLAFIVSMFPFVGMMGAAPFNVVGAPVEVYSGPRAEFNGKYLGILMTQRMIFSVSKLVLWMNLFLGGASSVIDLLWKTFALFLFQTIFSIIFPRFKLEQAVDFLWRIPTVIGIIAIIITIWFGV